MASTNADGQTAQGTAHRSPHPVAAPIKRAFDSTGEACVLQSVNVVATKRLMATAVADALLPQACTHILVSADVQPYNISSSTAP